ncbi:transmembrane protein 53-A-like isoform X1 [Chaetodon trifascialis]|uniref:transmembrane protein 53-A-like isoform X1 n=1 Tax=Chaetodon trifascialis TaxID=109706 RepID=UPI003993B43C
MGNMLLSTGFFGTDVIPKQVSGAKFIIRRISSGITYYYTPFSFSDSQMTPPPRSVSAPSPSPPSASDSSSPLLSDSPSHTPVSSQNQSDSASPSRPLLLLFSWLGAQPAAVAKYRNLYLDRGMDVLVVRSSVMHFLWPRWGLDYGLEVLTVLEEPQFSGRVVLVHASSIGGFTFSQILVHIARGPKEHAGLAKRVMGQIYDSLVVGTLEHMAIGLGKTLVPRFEGFVKNTAMLYFWLFKTHTADFYDNSIHVFHNSPITAPALFFFSENDPLCDPVVMEKCINYWRKRGVTVVDRKWKESIHAAHMRCHPEDYLSTLEKFLNSLPISCISVQTVGGVNA